MKKLLLLAFLFPLIISAQHEFGYHATWYFSYGGYGELGYKKVFHDGDTVINGIEWLKFEVTGANWIKTGPDPDDVVVDTNKVWDPIYLATRNDSVFRLLDNSNTPYLLYDFNALVGNKWQFAPSNTFMGCDSISIATVEEIGIDTIGGQVLEYMNINLPMDTVYYGSTPYYQPVCNEVINTKVYREIGSLSYISLFDSRVNSCDGTSIDFYYNHSLVCFSNDSVSVSLSNKACDFVPYISLEEHKPISFELYPNPTNGRVSIESDEIVTKVEVYSLDGQKLIETSRTENIELPASSGMYMVAIYFEDGRRVVSKVVRE